MTAPPASSERQRAVATSVVKRLRAAGHEAWFVGGCVREMLLGHVPKDFDVTTDADPDRVEALFDHVVEVGRRFGVMTVVEDGVHVEVATFRTEGSYSDGRRPDDVSFASAEEDVSRRDFTINALLHDPLEDRIVDHVGGRADLEAGLIRTVGDPEQRFREDHLRLLRAVRFAARFGFALEPATEAALRTLAPRVAVVSAERIREELERMLLDPRRVEAVRLLHDLGLLAAALPALAGAAPFAPPLDRLAALPERVSAAVAWSALLAGALEGDALDALLDGLRFSTAARKAVRTLVRRRGEPREWERASTAERRRFLAGPLREELLLLAGAEARAAGESLDFLEGVREDLEAFGAELPEPWVTGADLEAAGVEAGPERGRFLARLFDEQLEGRLADRDEALARLRTLAAGAA